MGNDQDLNALMSSEVFRNYLAIEQEREAKAHLLTDEQVKSASRKFEEQNKVLEAFANFELQVKGDEILKKAFLDMQHQISSNPELAKKLGNKFVNAIMMLDLEDSTF
jgi:hypothetical protein